MLGQTYPPPRVWVAVVAACYLILELRFKHLPVVRRDHLDSTAAVSISASVDEIARCCPYHVIAGEQSRRENRIA